MTRWDRAFSIRAEKAIKNLEADLEAMFESAIARGMDPDAFEQALLDDLDDAGPIFGKFLNQTLGAAETAVTAAQQQGEVLGASAKLFAAGGGMSDQDLRRLIFEDDPGELDGVVSRATQSGAFTWIALLVNTCPFCLPYHGTTMSGQEWMDRGVSPTTIHGDNGISAPCYCRLVPAEVVSEDRGDLVAPLKRNPVETKTGLKGNRRTVRGVAQIDIDKALAARDKALKTKEGKRALRLLGQSVEIEDDEENGNT